MSVVQVETPSSHRLAFVLYAGVVCDAYRAEGISRNRGSLRPCGNLGSTQGQAQTIRDALRGPRKREK
ncbi:hypothetical protein CEXT_530971 [Caerostris extrusa]|uniref:Uncharacterized protein n=1 Tax=Caerostris extrusa TaxID=172846 RepID=A0AAV4RR96_CAEEX|nr:hypothetical protein CEXT_530971 [Caerostris extrusa]